MDPILLITLALIFTGSCGLSYTLGLAHGRTILSAVSTPSAQPEARL